MDSCYVHLVLSTYSRPLISRSGTASTSETTRLSIVLASLTKGSSTNRQKKCAATKTMGNRTTNPATQHKVRLKAVLIPIQSRSPLPLLLAHFSDRVDGPRTASWNKLNTSAED